MVFMLTRRLAVVALSCYAAGVGIGLIICNRAWITSSGEETRYRRTQRCD